MPPSPQHVPLPVSPVAGVKRPAPSLLPAFEPTSSSPALPRPMKRLPHASPAKLGDRERHYPTPIPSSSTMFPSSSSSPPQALRTRRPGLIRNQSAVSERAPLATVPSIELSEHGEPTLMGRSSNTSHYQLSTNKLISRIHVSAVYIPAIPPARKKVQIECRGWNGVKVHCLGKAWELIKGDTFTSETEDADIMVDVQDARVLVTWPKHGNKMSTPTDSDSNWDSESSPQRNAMTAARSRPLDTSPLRQQNRLRSPVSPSPAVQAAHAPPSGHIPSDPPIPVPVQVYEDEPSDEDKEKPAAGNTQATQSTQVASQTFGLLDASPNLNGFSDDNDEENDPIISSFGPYGANLGARLESFTTKASPIRHPLNTLKEESISPQRLSQAGVSPKRRRHNTHHDVSDSVQREDESGNAITHHVINQLAYSRLQSTPLSTLMQNLPAALRVPSFTDEALKAVLERTRCVGMVEREGKDAAGKRLESEYYYIPEADADGSRREVIEGMGGRGLRNCRKSHKQYYWRKPK